MDSYQALRRLLEGNERYVAAKQTYTNGTAARRLEVAREQRPFAAILGCADSRVPAEIVFDQGLGDLFVVRVAGPVADEAVLGSLEFAATELGVPLILVLGHERCGAIKATIEALERGDDPPGHIAALTGAIRPAVKQARGRPGDLVDNALRAHIAGLVERLRAARPILGERVRQGQLKIAGARYSLETGQVEITVP